MKYNDAVRAWGAQRLADSDRRVRIVESTVSVEFDIEDDSYGNYCGCKSVVFIRGKSKSGRLVFLVVDEFQDVESLFAAVLAYAGGSLSL